MLRHPVLYSGLGPCLKTFFLLSGSLLVPSEVAETLKKLPLYLDINRTKFPPSGKENQIFFARKSPARIQNHLQQLLKQKTTKP